MEGEGGVLGGAFVDGVIGTELASLREVLDAAFEAGAVVSLGEAGTLDGAFEAGGVFVSEPVSLWEGEVGALDGALEAAVFGRKLVSLGDRENLAVGDFAGLGGAGASRGA